MYADVHRLPDLAVVTAVDPAENVLDVSDTGNTSGDGGDGGLLSLLERILAADALEPQEVVGLDGSDVGTVENTDLKVLDLGVERRAGCDKVGERLVDDGISTNVLGNLLLGAVEGNKLLGICEVDSVDMGVSIIRQKDSCQRTRGGTNLMAGAQLAK